MCGIVGYTGPRQCQPILYNGLLRVEYRGYDSAGFALVGSNGMVVIKDQGKVSELGVILNGGNGATCGIAHTRWATHGEPNRINAHPHVSQSGHIALVHNGIVENYEILKMALIARGCVFTTDTDTEVLVHLIEEAWEGNLEQAVAAALRHVVGAFGIAVVTDQEPGKIVGARRGSPLIVGIGQGEYFVASDFASVIEHTKRGIYLEDDQMVIITPDGYQVQTLNQQPVTLQVKEINLDLAQIEKGGFPHFMLKEIHEQPRSIRNALRGRLQVEAGNAHLGGLNLSVEELREVNRIILVGCGTSWHACLVGEYLLEAMLRMPVEVEYASEFRYRQPVLDPRTLVIVLSQSGETADTLAALKEAKRGRAKVMGICNVVGSTIPREAKGGIYIHAGPEIGVASTKAFTGQVTTLVLLGLYLGRLLDRIDPSVARDVAANLDQIPDLIEQTLATATPVAAQLAEIYGASENFLYLGRGFNFPVALEGALKLKEISYIHAEGYPAAEMKHGPIALIDENMPVVFLCTRNGQRDKVLSNMAEVRTRKGRIIAIATEGDEEILRKADHVIYVPATHYWLTPLLTVVPLQLLAYYIAVKRGCNVDQPKNLAKSVTVE